MSDFLDVLAAQAAGVRPGIRPRLPSRFDPPPRALPAEGGPVAEPLVGDEWTEPPPPRGRSAVPRSRPDPPDPSPPPARGEPAPPAPSVAAARHEPIPTPQPDLFVRAAADRHAEATPPPPAASEPDTPIPADVERPRPARPDNWGNPVESARPAPATASTEPLATRPSPAPAADRAAPPMPQAPAGPRPILTRLAAGPAADRVPAEAPSMPRVEPEAGPPPVQVTIGRVEVRAILPPAATRPEPASRPRPALSLDEYLGRSAGRNR